MFRFVLSDLGTVPGMKLRANRTIVTTTPPDRVFAFLGDFRNAEEWDPGTVECELVSGSVGPGATYRNVSEFLGSKTELTYTTVAHEPTSRVHFQGRNDSFVGNDRLSLSPEGAGTRVEYDADFEFSGFAQLGIPVVAAYLPFLANKTVKQLKESLDAL